jgi:hypothetical protein
MRRKGIREFLRILESTVWIFSQEAFDRGAEIR